MPAITFPVPSHLLADVERDGFCFATAGTMRPLLDANDGLIDWNRFADSWNHLAADPYIAATGRLRRRRHATFTASADGIAQEPHQAHYQSLTYNRLQGDIQRWFEPLELATAQSRSLRTILACCQQVFDRLLSGQTWHVEVHQFRIEASAHAAGEPTPEGSHRDGVDFVMVLMIDRENIASGSTSIHSPAGEPLGEFTLTHPLDAAWIHDPRVFHGVTPVSPIDPARPSHRDVLVVTFRSKLAA